MRQGRVRTAALAAVSVGAMAGAAGGTASATMIKLPTVQKVIAREKAAIRATGGGVSLHAPPCPENGLLPQIPGGLVSLGNCGLGQPPAATLPLLSPMVYWGGHVQVHPKQYIVYWGWGQSGAFPKHRCTAETINEGARSTTIGCDPDGAGKYMADFVQQMGGTQWANVQDQYFMTDAAGRQTYIDEHSKHMLAGMWADDSVPVDPANAKNPTNYGNTTATNPAGPTNTYSDLAAEATRAAAHFGLRGAALKNANIIIAQPAGLSDPNAVSSGYCAFHDYTVSDSPGNFYYKDPRVGFGIAYTNMPYALAIGGGSGCGENGVNSGTHGRLDAFSIALGHEIQETATDPGAGAIVGNITTGTQTYYGAWYDALETSENGDKCAYVGTPLNAVFGVPNLPVEPNLLPVPGAMGNITGNAGKKFAVQSLWSNASAAGTGYCAGVASTDLPGPLAGEPPYAPSTLIGLTKRAIASGMHSKHGAKAKQGMDGIRGKRHAGKVTYRVL